MKQSYILYVDLQKSIEKELLFHNETRQSKGQKDQINIGRKGALTDSFSLENVFSR